MIVLFTSTRDLSTNRIIDWLSFFNNEYYRINDNIIVKDADEPMILIGCDETKISNILKIELNNNVVFFRRPRNNGLDFITSIRKSNSNVLNTILEKQKKSSKIVKEFIVDYIISHGKRTIGDYYKTKLNKLKVLNKARTIGLKIPDTIVSSSALQVCHFFHQHNKRIINKPVEEVLSYFGNSNRFAYHASTILITKEHQIFEKDFSISLFQEYIEKQYELRIFYFCGEIFAAAIFSQQNKKTIVDFRNYDINNPNKIVPYSLPASVVLKLEKLMVSLGLNTGSIDMLVDNNDQYYFLEINPIGQYGFISKLCNSDLDYIIAQKLSHYDQK